MFSAVRSFLAWSVVFQGFEEFFVVAGEVFCGMFEVIYPGDSSGDAADHGGKEGLVRVFEECFCFPDVFGKVGGVAEDEGFLNLFEDEVALVDLKSEEGFLLVGEFFFPGFEGEEGCFEGVFDAAELTLAEDEFVGVCPEFLYPLVGADEPRAAEGAVFAVFVVEGSAVGAGDGGDVVAAGLFDGFGAIGAVFPGEVVDFFEERYREPE